MSHIVDEKDVKNVYAEDNVHVESLGPGPGKDVIAQDFGTYIHDAQAAVQGQKESSVRAALSKYRYGVMFSIVFSA